jgi:hypothetical protein
LVEILKNAGRQDLASRRFTGPCHACHQLLGDPESLAILRAALDPKRLDLAATRWYMEKHGNLFDLVVIEEGPPSRDVVKVT